MSATAFQRRRREALEQEALKKQEEEKQTVEMEKFSPEEMKEYTNDELRARLDQLGINYKSTDDKDDLITLLSLPLA